MLILLPATFFGLSFFLLRKNDSGAEWRPAFLAAAVGAGALLTVLTESLSLMRALTTPVVAGGWAAAILVLAGLRRGDFRKRTDFPILPLPQPGSLSAADWIWPAAAAAITLATGAVALAAAPNTWDSLTYHLPRVAHWIQNAEVAFYPTHILRQLHQTPWAEYAVLHAQLLAGSDRFANLVQWAALAGSCVGVSLLAKELGAGPRGQGLAAFVAATLPMGLMQATSTMTDFTAAFWLLAAVCFLLRLKDDGRPGTALVAGGALGLALLTKATDYLFVFPFLIWACAALLRRLSLRSVGPLTIVAAAALILNLAFFSRNFALYGSPLGPGREGENAYVNGVFTPLALASNVVRELALEVGTPFPEVNSLLEAGINRLHRAAGFSSSDPRTTWSPYNFRIPALSYYDNDAGNPLHLILGCICAAVVAVSWKRNRGAFAFLLALAAAFLLFCLVLKWQPWNSRLMLPLFVLGAALTGVVLGGVRPPRAGWAHAATAALLIGALPGVVNNPSRPVFGSASVFTVPRERQYFANLPWLYEPYAGAAQQAAAGGCASVGLILGSDDWEYPLWVLLHDLSPAIRIEHVNVQNVSAGSAAADPGYASFRPCALIVIREDPPQTVEVSGVAYRLTWQSRTLSVYRAETGPEGENGG
jgi:4-amino-4-deoxy-L-arabinose transferase-like glycosyltransferase